MGGGSSDSGATADVPIERSSAAPVQEVEARAARQLRGVGWLDRDLGLPSSINQEGLSWAGGHVMSCEVAT